MIRGGFKSFKKFKPFKSSNGEMKLIQKCDQWFEM
jgi:hypothetical protein